MDLGLHDHTVVTRSARRKLGEGDFDGLSLEGEWISEELYDESAETMRMENLLSINDKQDQMLRKMDLGIKKVRNQTRDHVKSHEMGKKLGN